MSGMSIDAFSSPTGARRQLRRFLRQRNAVIGGVIVAFVIFLALFSPWLAPKSTEATDLLNAWAPPGGDNLLGTDKLGRDSLSRLIAGARTSLFIASAVLALTLSFG